MNAENQSSSNHWRARLHEVIFEADTTAGKTFDLILIFSIVASIVAVMLESVASIRAEYGELLYKIEWVFTILFTIEYVLRLLCVRHPVRYAKSFFGVVDLLAVIPTYLDIILPGTRFLFVIRVLRLLRVFRVLKLAHFVGEADTLMQAMKASQRKILVFLFAVGTIVVIMGSAMYVIEGEEHGFDSIPHGIYWAIVTLTTVGYGDIAPKTPMGQTLASMLMILGYAIIAVPTGIVTSEMVHSRRVSTQSCLDCSSEGHEPGAKFCKDCGASFTLDNPAA